MYQKIINTIHRFFCFIGKSIRLFCSFLVFLAKWISPFLIIVGIVFLASFWLVSWVPKELQENQLLITMVPAIIAFFSLKLIEAYFFILNKKSKHLKRIALSLAELNKIHLITYRNNEIVRHKLPALQTVLRNVRNIREAGNGNQIQHIGNVCSDGFDSFINLSEESKMEILNVDLINTIESLTLQIESNNKNIGNINARDKKVIKQLDEFLIKLNSSQLKPSDFFKIEMALDNLISIINNFRRELKRTRYYSLLLITKLSISEREDPISFDIWVVTRYSAEFNRNYSFSSLKRQFLTAISKQFQLKNFEIKTSSKLLKKELARVSNLIEN